jgi:hypothetical protein
MNSIFQMFHTIPTMKTGDVEVQETISIPISPEVQETSLPVIPEVPSVSPEYPSEQQEVETLRDIILEQQKRISSLEKSLLEACHKQPPCYVYCRHCEPPLTA